MVRTVSPKASATPAKPTPKPGKAAASTALPHPPNTNQKVPKNSANARLLRDMPYLRIPAIGDTHLERCVVGDVRFLLLSIGWKSSARYPENYQPPNVKEAPVPPSRRTPLVGDLGGPRGTIPSELRRGCQ